MIRNPATVEEISPPLQILMDSDAKASAAGKLAPFRATKRARFHVADAFVKYFPTPEFSSYDDFLGIGGEVLKQEHRTRVVLIRRDTEGDDKHVCSFVVKSYRYPLFQRLRTGFQISKAENEFKSLLHLKNLGVAAVEPVACGVERTALGFVRSCFLITRYLEAAVNLSDWQWQNAEPDQHQTIQRAAHLKRLGSIFQRLHGARFFLFTAKTKNILLRRISEDSEMHLLDIPYARTLHWLPLARWAQSRDLGYCLGSFYPAITAEDLASFYEGYLPDALGDPVESVQRRVLRAIRVQQNVTPLSRSVEAVKHHMRQRRRARRSRLAER